MGSPAILDRRAARGGRVPVAAPTRAPRSLAAGLAVAAMVFAIIGIGAHYCGHGEHHVHSTAHAGVTATHHSGTVAGPHAFLLGDCAASHHPEQLAYAIRPQLPSAAAGLGVAVTVIAIAVAGLSSLTWAGRDPPRRHAYAPGGRSMLTRFCLARR